MDICGLKPRLSFSLPILNKEEFVHSYVSLPPSFSTNSFVAVSTVLHPFTMRHTIVHSVALGLAGLRVAEASVCKPRSLCKLPI